MSRITSTPRSTIGLIVFLAITTFGSTPLPAADTLGDVLREAGWQRIIGTWVDAETGGEKIRATYEWKIDDRVIATTTRRFGKESAALICINAKSGDIFHIGGDSEGGSFLGKWQLETNAYANLTLGMVEPDGGQETMTVQYELVDDNTMKVRIQMPLLPLSFELVRQQAELPIP